MSCMEAPLLFKYLSSDVGCRQRRHRGMSEAPGDAMPERGRQLRGLQRRQSGLLGWQGGGLQKGKEDQLWEDRRI